MQNIKTIAGTFTIGTYEIPKQYVCAKTPTITRLAFWTNIMFVLLTCARGWAGLTLYKTQEETL